MELVWMWYDEKIQESRDEERPDACATKTDDEVRMVMMRREEGSRCLESAMLFETVSRECVAAAEQRK